MFETLRYIAVVICWSFWIFIMWVSLVAALRTAILFGFQTALDLYFTRRMQWMKEMDVQFGAQEDRNSRARSSFN